MNFKNIKEKALWRMPNASEIMGIDSQSRGDDKFIIAPFLRDEKTFFVKGKSTIIAKEEVGSFIENTNEIYTITHQASQLEYTNAVEKAIVEINNKQLEKVVLARQVFIEKEINAATLFLSLEQAYPNAFVFWFTLQNGITMIGATPETLLSKADDKLFIEALGGTKQGYGYSEKEYNEHAQIVKYISAILIENSFQFSKQEIFSKNAGNVEHLCTPFTVVSRGFTMDKELIALLHPTPAICGVPYQSALNFILANEGFQRNYYAGYIGPNLANSKVHYFVNLRSATLYKNGIQLYAGAGINAASIAHDEWLETENKLQTIGKWL